MSGIEAKWFTHINIVISLSTVSLCDYDQGRGLDHPVGFFSCSAFFLARIIIVPRIILLPSDHTPDVQTVFTSEVFVVLFRLVNVQ